MRVPFVVWLAQEVGWPVSLMVCVWIGLLVALAAFAGWMYFYWWRKP